MSTEIPALQDLARPYEEEGVLPPGITVSEAVIADTDPGILDEAVGKAIVGHQRAYYNTEQAWFNYPLPDGAGLRMLGNPELYDEVRGRFFEAASPAMADMQAARELGEQVRSDVSRLSHRSRLVARVAAPLMGVAIGLGLGHWDNENPEGPRRASEHSNVKEVPPVANLVVGAGGGALILSGIVIPIAESAKGPLARRSARARVRKAERRNDAS